MTAKALTIDDWLQRDLPEPDYVLGNWLTTTSRVLLNAPTGVGKTNFSMALAIHIAAGTDFLHWRGHHPCNVLYVDGEMSRRLLKQRVADAAARLGTIPYGFRALSHEDVPDFAPLNTVRGQRQIESEIAAIGRVDLITFDSVMCLLAGDPKDPQPWQEVMPWIRDLTKRKIGQLWLHHTGHDTSKGYGDKTREWQLDTVLHLDPVANLETDVSFNLEFRKARERTPQTRADFQTCRIALVGDRWTGAAEVARVSRVSPLGLKFLGALEDAIVDHAEVREQRRCAHFHRWRDECQRLGLMNTDRTKKQSDALFGKYRRELIAANRIACDTEWAWLVA